MNLAASTEAELLGLMAGQEDDREHARAAWGELYVRHRRYVFAVVSRSFGRFLGEERIADLVVDTFRRAFEWASNQRDRQQVIDRFSADSGDGTRRKVLGWLAVIAERLFKDRFREEAAEAHDFAWFLDDWKSAREQPSGVSNSPALAILEGVLAELSELDAEALRVSLPWYDPESRMFAFARGEAARVAALLGITPEGLRQRRHRAIKHVEQRLLKAGLAATVEGESS